MAKPAACPNLDQLRQLATGRLPAPQLETLAGHVEGCSHCLAKVQTLSPTDTFVQALSHATQMPDGPDATVVAKLIAKLKRLAVVAGADPTAGETMVPRRAAPAPVAFDGDLTGTSEDIDSEPAWDFLAPAQSDGEIGRLGSYRILEVLGHGGMGVVFRAEDPSLKRVVALKAMLPTLAVSGSSKKRFLREAQTAAGIKHDNIVTIHQVAEDRGIPFLAMEFLQGEPLDVCLKREGKLPLGEVLRIGREIAEGLHAAHDTGLIHRDIKPANIWLERRPGSKASRVKILDFGLARSAEDHDNVTKAGTILGTPAYMAPEQAQGGKVDRRCDLFSLGCVLYTMSTGQTPFKGPDAVSTLMAVSSMQEASPRSLNPELPRELSDLIQRLLSKNPEKRPNDAQEVADALERIQVAGAGGSRAGLRPAPARRGSRRGLLVACGLLLAAVLVAGIVFFVQTPKGTIRVEINDDDIEVVLNKTGAKIKGADKQGDINVAAGEHSLSVKRGDMEFETEKFVLKKGETVTVKVEFLQGKLQAVLADGRIVGVETAKVKPVVHTAAWTPTPEQKAFLDAMAVVNESERRKAIDGKLAELLPNRASFTGGFGSSVFEPKDEPAKTCRVTYFLREIWPLVGLPTLTSLDLTQTTVTDFRPLTHLPITDLKLYLLLDNLASEEALKSMPTLKTINGRPAAEFWKIRAQVRQDIQKRAGVGSALSPEIQSAWLKTVLKQLDPNFEERYTYFSFDKATGRGRAHLHGVFDLSPLRALPVHDLSVLGHVCDLTPLIGTKITSFTCEESRVRDLAPLAGLPLKQLHLKGCLVDDLKPIAKLPLEEFTYRGMTPGDQSKLGMLTDITPLSKMPLKKLTLTFAEVNDLRPLAGMKLTELRCTGTRVIDLAPLKGQPLEFLEIGFAGAGNRGWMGLPVLDLQPVAGLDLVELHGLVFRLYFEPDEKVLRGFARLKKINGMEPAAFWKVIDDLREKDKKFLDSVAQLAPEKAVEAVREEVRKRSPLYNGNAGKYQVALNDCTIRDNAVSEAIMWADWQADRHNPFAPLRAFPKLRKVTYEARDVREADFSPLLTLPIEEIQCNERLIEYNRPVLRAMKHLKTINGKPAKEALDVPAVEPKPMPLAAWAPTPEQQAYLDAAAKLPIKTRIESVTRKLTELNVGLEYPSVAPIFEPKDAEPTTCRLAERHVAYIWPLAALTSLTSVDVEAGSVLDFAPLSRLPLKELKLKLVLDDVKSEQALKSIAALQTVNGRPAAEFWAERTAIRKDIDGMMKGANALSLKDRMEWFGPVMKKLNPKCTASFVDKSPDRNQMGLWKEDGLTHFGARAIEGDVHDISPVRALGADTVNLSGGMFYDLKPLAQTKIQKLTFAYNTIVRDLTPLAGLPLKVFVADTVPIADIGPLKDAKLEMLHIRNTAVRDISVLKGMPLTSLDISETKVEDLTPLAGMKLKKLNAVPYTPISDIAALKDMPLEELSLSRVRDVSVLRGMPLKELSLHFRLHFESDEQVLRGLPLVKLNGMPVADFWKDVEKRRKADADTVAELAKVKVEEAGLKKALGDKVGRKGFYVKIKDGVLDEAGFGDGDGPGDCYAPFMAFPTLRKLSAMIGPADFSPLLKLPNLEEIECPPAAVAYNLPVLKLMPKLKTINGKPAKEVLDAVAAGKKP